MYLPNGGVDAEVVGEEPDDQEAEEEEEKEKDEGGELSEVWPQPKEDDHAYVAGDGGVRRRRTVHGMNKQGGEDKVPDGHSQEIPKRYVVPRAQGNPPPT